MKNLMKKRTMFAISILGAGLLLVACGKDDDGAAKSDTSSESSATSAEVAALEGQIAALKALIEEADDAKVIESLTEELGDLQDLLDELTAPGCGDEGGACIGTTTVLDEFGPVIDAACELAFNCCTASESILGFGRDVTSAAECKAVAKERLAEGRSFSTESFHPGFGFELRSIPSVAASLERGAIELDKDAIAACVASLEAVDCSTSREESKNGGTCGQQETSDCYYGNFYKGVLTEGAACNNDEDINECAGTSYCGGGICVPANKIGDSCAGGSWCSEGYCHALTQVCTDYAQAGEACVYNDPTHKVPNSRQRNETVTKCDGGTTCSVLSDKCISNCGAGAGCRDDYDCNDEFFCDQDSLDGILYGERVFNGGLSVSNGYLNGTCAAQGDTGADCTDDSECLSDDCAVTKGGGTCVAESLCDADTDCAGTEYCDGICETKSTDGSYCDGDNWCAGGLCANNVCDTAGTTDGDCETGSGSREALIDGARACSTGQYCSVNGTCSAELALAADCDLSTDAEADVACGDGNFCTGDSRLCTVRSVARGGDCDTNGNQSTSEQPTYRGCVDGLICAGYNDGTADVYVCLPPLDEEGVRTNGEYCGTNYNNFYDRTASSARCESGLCKSANVNDGFGFCAPLVADGKACDASEAYDRGLNVRGPAIPQNSEQGVFEDCAPESFCRITDLSVDTMGVCTPLVEPGGFCDGSVVSGYLVNGIIVGENSQCLYGDSCVNDGAVSYCPAISDEDLMCPLVVGTSSGPGGPGGPGPKR